MAVELFPPLLDQAYSIGGVSAATIAADHAAWLSYVPTLTQSVTVSKTVLYAKYIQIGKTVIGNVDLSCTSAGTASQAIVVGLPVAATTVYPGGIGTISVYISSTTQFGQLQMFSTTTVGGGVGGVGNALGITPAVTLASGSLIRCSFMYEAA